MTCPAGATISRIPDRDRRGRVGRRSRALGALLLGTLAAIAASGPPAFGQELAGGTGPTIGLPLPESASAVPSFHATTAAYEERRAGVLGIPAVALSFDRRLDDEEIVRRTYPMLAPESPLEGGDAPTLVDAIDRWDALRHQAVVACGGDEECIHWFDREDPRKRPVAIGHCGVFEGVWVRTVQLATRDGRRLGPRQQIRAILKAPDGDFEFEAYREQVTVELPPGEPPRYVYARTPIVRGRRLGTDEWFWALTSHLETLREN